MFEWTTDLNCSGKNLKQSKIQPRNYGSFTLLKLKKIDGQSSNKIIAISLSLQLARAHVVVVAEAWHPKVVLE